MTTNINDYQSRKPKRCSTITVDVKNERQVVNIETFFHLILHIIIIISNTIFLSYLFTETYMYIYLVFLLHTFKIVRLARLDGYGHGEYIL